MSYARYLVDTSALVRILRDPELLDHLGIVTDGTVAVCDLTEIEHLHSARSKADRDHQRARLRKLFSWVVMPDRVFDDAVNVQDAMFSRGTHRSAGTVDLLTAAAARSHGLRLLHYDADFEQVAAVTGQPTRWVAKPGSID